MGNIDTSGITMIGEVKKVMERRGLKVLNINHVLRIYCLNLNNVWLNLDVLHMIILYI